MLQISSQTETFLGLGLTELRDFPGNGVASNHRGATKALLEPTGILNNGGRCDQEEEQTDNVCLQHEKTIIAHRRYHFLRNRACLLSGHHWLGEFQSLKDRLTGESESAAAAFKTLVDGEAFLLRRHDAHQLPANRAMWYRLGPHDCDPCSPLFMTWRRNGLTAQIAKVLVI